MVAGQHGVIGQHVHQHVLVAVKFDIEIVQILHHQMVVYHALDQLLKLIVHVVILHVVCKLILRIIRYLYMFVLCLGANPSVGKFLKKVNMRD
jgi:hypothetical protein